MKLQKPVIMPSTRNPLKYWLSAFAMDGAMLALVVAWLFFGVKGAGNFAQFLIVLFSTLAVFSALYLSHTSNVQALWRPKGFTAYHYATELVLMSLLAWHGHFLMAGMIVGGFLAIETARQSAIREFRGGRRRALDNMTTLSGAGVCHLIKPLKKRLYEIDTYNSVFDMRYCTPFLAKSVLSKRAPQEVVLEHCDRDNTKELYELIQQFPGTHFYVTWQADLAPDAKESSVEAAPNGA